MWNIEIPVTLLPPYALYVFAVGGFATCTDSTFEDTQAFTQKYNFTPEQINNFREIQNQYNKPLIELNEEIKQAERILNDLIMGTASASEISEEYHKIQAMKQQAAEVYFKMFLAMRDVLTPVQRRQFGELIPRSSN